jgi:hypothetical protein
MVHCWYSFCSCVFAPCGCSQYWSAFGDACCFHLQGQETPVVAGLLAHSVILKMSLWRLIIPCTLHLLVQLLPLAAVPNNNTNIHPPCSLLYWRWKQHVAPKHRNTGHIHTAGTPKNKTYFVFRTTYILSFIFPSNTTIHQLTHSHITVHNWVYWSYNVTTCFGSWSHPQEILVLNQWRTGTTLLYRMWGCAMDSSGSLSWISRDYTWVSERMNKDSALLVWLVATAPLRDLPRSYQSSLVRILCLYFLVCYWCWRRGSVWCRQPGGAGDQLQRPLLIILCLTRV